MITPRKTLKDAVWLTVAYALSELATCSRRKVGAVLVDKYGNVLSTGFNGNCQQAQHCIDSPCPGANLPSGTGLDKCQAIHAEQNALLQCRNQQDIHTVYCTTAPCVFCVRMLANTPAVRIVFAEDYPHNEAKDYWLKLGRRWEQVAPTIRYARVPSPTVWELAQELVKRIFKR